MIESAQLALRLTKCNQQVVVVAKAAGVTMILIMRAVVAEGLHVNKAGMANQIPAQDSHLSFEAKSKAAKSLGLIPDHLFGDHCRRYSFPRRRPDLHIHSLLVQLEYLWHLKPSWLFVKIWSRLL